ncbi:MAG: PRC-barrel domain-containing protein [Gammaproteobacteria bacterium]
MGDRVAARLTPVQATGQRGADIVDTEGDSSGPGPRIMAADTLEGNNVVNSEGETLGEIKHIMVDVPQGRVAYAVLSFGGFLGVGDKLFAIPWSALTLDADNHNFILDVPEQRLKDAPGFDKDHWPTMADERWASQVHSYYHSRPYWEV